jgi:Fic family protein
MEPYIPRSLPLNDINWVQHIEMMGKANRALAKYEGILRGIVNQDVLLSPLTTQEAVISSKIEGTTVTLEDVLEYNGDVKSDFDARQTQDIIEVENYRKAMNRAVELSRYNPLTIDTVKELHLILLTGARGRNKDPGKTRTTQNYLGQTGATIKSATFIPPKPEDVQSALQNWENYLRMEEKDPLVQLAVLKAQFELIHPFLDGNGRIGRMLVPLILYHKKILSSPLFYISAYFEEHQLQYYTRLNAISKENDWDGWISFFLQATFEQAEDNCAKATEILHLYSVMKQKIHETLKSKYSIQVLDFLFSYPIFTSTKFIKETGIPKQSAVNLMDQLEKNEIIIIRKIGKGRTPSSYRFERLLEISKSTHYHN